MELVRLTPAVLHDNTRLQELYSHPLYEHSHMAAGLYYPNPPRGEDYAYIGGEDSLPGFYDGTSGESSMGSPALLQESEELKEFAQYGQFQPYLYPYQTPEMSEAAHLAATIELKIEDLYDDVDLRTKRSSAANPATSQVHSRRRAQNRASQRAFRNRKEKHVKEVEARLHELEGKYHDLSQSYESLQTEYVLAKEQLERLTAEERAQSQSLSESPRDTLSAPHPPPHPPQHPSNSGFDGGGGGGAGEDELSSILFENEVFSFESAAH